MKKFKNWFNYQVPEPRALDQNDLTIPGQDISVKEVMRRLEAGIDVPVIPMEYDPDNTSLPRFVIRDLTDLTKVRNYIEDVKFRLEEAKKKTVEVMRNEERTKSSKKADETPVGL